MSRPRSRSTYWPTNNIPIDEKDPYFKTKQKNLAQRTKIMFQNIPSSKYWRIVVILLVFATVVLFLAESPDSISSYSNRKSSSTKSKSSSSSNKNKDESTIGLLSCTKSYDGIRPITQYVVMIDAGSSGSRVHVYEFNNCQAMPQLIKEHFKMMEPGLSHFDSDAEAAAASLDELLEFAVSHVPEDSRSCTPVAVKATAGLRMLDGDKPARILDAVRSRLETKYPFAVVEGDGVSIMDGSDEGVYAWITANYLLGNIGTAEKTPTAAVFDLGGGSTQIVFEPTFNVPDKVMAPGDHKYELEFGNRHFELYQHSHLGFGLNVAREKVNEQIVTTYIKSQGSATVVGPIVNPCLPPNTSWKNVRVKVQDGTATKDGPSTKEMTVDFVGPTEPSTSQCRKIAEMILKKDEICQLEPCSFNGVHQPSLVDSFMKDSDVFIFSFFYDRTFPLGMPSSFSVDELKDLAAKVCKGKIVYDSFEAIDGAVQQLEENPQWCLDLSYMVAILHTGYDIPVHREVKIAKKIKQNELGWCLGASLPLLDSKIGGWTCKVKEHY